MLKSVAKKILTLNESLATIIIRHSTWSVVHTSVMLQDISSFYSLPSVASTLLLFHLRLAV